ncbi:hypothetical protein PRNP1_001541 [Phytophthora ramorum]
MDGYSRVKLLGEGAFGRVFLMREKKHGGRLVCVKQIHRVHHPRQVFVPAGRSKPLGVEVELMKKLRHPNLIRLLTSFIGPSPLRQQHIVMEFCSGGDLRTYLKAVYRSNGLLEDKIWYWFIQLALGLHHMHQQRVLHRDLKTANIFLSNAGYLVLGDLGIARTLTSGDMATTVIGTPLYMAPEVLEGKDYSFSSDVWALGCVLYELCTGKPPFTANNTPQLLNKICHGDYIPVQKRGNLATSRLPTLVASMLSARPERRPSVDQILRDSLARIQMRRYCVDRLRSTSMTDEERRVMMQQMTALGENVKVQSSATGSGKNTKNVESSVVNVNAEAYSRHHACSSQHREGVEKQLIAARERERQEHIVFALEKLQQLRLQLPASKGEASKSCSDAASPPTPLVGLDAAVRHKSPRDALWRDPVRAVSDAPKSVDRIQPANLGRSNSVPKELAFTGIPRPGVPLTGMTKSFTSRRPVCHDVRILKQKEAAKAAERYKRHLNDIYTPPGPAQHARRKSLASEGTTGRNKRDEDTDAAILLSMASLREALA